jgi:hypothetical protein
MNATKTCGRCGAKFTCGPEAGQAACWCAELPHIMELSAEGDCYCPACLRTMIEARLAGAPPQDCPQRPADG